MSEGKLPIEIQIAWLLGLSLSVIGLILQTMIYTLIPCSRKLDQKLLTQLTIARILNVTFEYVVTNIIVSESSLCNVLFSIYFQTDAALVCWMFFFTKNLYDKVIHVFTKDTNFTIMSVMVWSLTSPIGLVCPILMFFDPIFFLCMCFFKIFAIVKFIILCVNLILFCKIFAQAVSKKGKNTSVLKICLVSLVLLCISGAQTQSQLFIKDLLPGFFGGQTNSQVWVAFGVINSYQVIAITIIFWISVDKTCESSITKTMARKIIKEAV